MACTSACLPKRVQSACWPGQYQSLSEIAVPLPLANCPKTLPFPLQIDKAACAIILRSAAARSGTYRRDNAGQSMGSSSPIGRPVSVRERPECTHVHTRTPAQCHDCAIQHLGGMPQPLKCHHFYHACRWLLNIVN